MFLGYLGDNHSTLNIIAFSDNVSVLLHSTLKIDNGQVLHVNFCIPQQYFLMMHGKSSVSQQRFQKNLNT